MAFITSQKYAMPPEASSPKPAFDPVKTMFGGVGGLPIQPAVAAYGPPSVTASLTRPAVSAQTTDPFANDSAGGSSFGGFGMSSLSQAEQNKRTNDFLNADLSGFANPAFTGGSGGVAAGSSFADAMQKTQQNQGFVKDLLLGNQFQNRFSGNNIGQLMQQLALEPQGLSDGARASLERKSSDVISGAADQATLDARNQLAARGFTDSAIAPRIEADIRQGAARDIQSAFDDIGVQDEQLGIQRQQNAVQQFLQLLGMENQAQQGAAQTIGNFQFPFLEGASAGAPASPAAPVQPAYGGQPNDAVMQRLHQEQLARQRATPRNPYELVQSNIHSTIGAGY